jgi:hypothetical protein
MGSRRSPNGTFLAERRPMSGPADGGVPASNAERVVFLEFTWKRHLAYDSLLTDPPAGYRFVVGDGRGQHAIKAASRFAPAYSALYALDRLVPVHLLKSYWDARTRPPAGTALTYAVNHLVLRDEPWVLDLPCEHVTNVLGGFRHFQRYRGLVKRVLAAGNCRRIIVNRRPGRRGVPGPRPAKKTSFAAVPRRTHKHSINKTALRDSGNIPGGFAKGEGAGLSLPSKPIPTSRWCCSDVPSEEAF